MTDRQPSLVYFTSPERGEKILNVVVDGEIVRYHLNQDQADRMAIEAPKVAIHSRASL